MRATNSKKTQHSQESRSSTRLGAACNRQQEDPAQHERAGAYHVHSIAAQVAEQAREQPCWPQQKFASRHLPVSLVQLKLSRGLSVDHMRSSGEVWWVACIILQACSKWDCKHPQCKGLGLATGLPICKACSAKRAGDPSHNKLQDAARSACMLYTPSQASDQADQAAC